MYEIYFLISSDKNRQQIVTFHNNRNIGTFAIRKFQINNTVY